MKFLTLLSAAYIGGALRHPHEGAIPTEDAEADKLVADGVAVDVTDGFSAAQVKSATPETNTAPGGSEPIPTPENPHQAEVAPATDDDSKPARRKAAADKE